MTQIDLQDKAAQLSSLLTRLTADDGVVASPPSPSEAMAIYALAVRLAEAHLARAGAEPVVEDDLAVTRDVLLSTRRLLRAALSRVEPEPASCRLVLIDGGASA